MIFKFRHETKGSHVHVAVFVANALDQTFAKSGDLVFWAGSEWDTFRRALLDGFYAENLIVEEREDGQR